MPMKPAEKSAIVDSSSAGNFQIYANIYIKYISSCIYIISLSITSLKTQL